MVERRQERIARDLMSEPHVAGRRISVLRVFDLVEGRGLEPRTVADRFDLDIADVYHALAYYHDHPAEMADLRSAREETMEAVREKIDRPPGVDPQIE